MLTKYEKFYAKQTHEWLESFKIRQEARKRFSFAILTEEAIKLLKPYAPFIEVGAGNGYWAYEMIRHGVKIIATDLIKIDTNTYKFTKKWTIIRQMSAKQAIREFPNYTLMIIWPCYNKPWAYEALKTYKGNILVYCGEDFGGCTADDNFHQLLEKEWKLDKDIDIPRWFGIYDHLGIYSRV